MGECQNLISQHQYRGINAVLTSCMGFQSPYWLSYKQALDHGGQVKKGEKGTPIVFWKFGTKQDSEGNESQWGFCSHSTVFNLEQIEGMDSIKALAAKRKSKRIDFIPIEACQSVADTYIAQGPKIDHHEQRAFYRPSTDDINMPKKESFNSAQEYYSTLFHEMTHSTGHKDRLARTGVTERNHFASHEYSKEELIAEMGSAFLCAQTGIDTATLDNSASYIASWIATLKGDSKLVLSAASQAHKAIDLINGKKEE